MHFLCKEQRVVKVYSDKVHTDKEGRKLKIWVVAISSAFPPSA